MSLRLSTRSLATLSRRALAPAAPVQARGKATLPQLDYEYSALEPSISTEIMTLHHTKHHATYVAGLNTALEKYEAALQGTGEADVKGLIGLQAAMKFNGGGHINHSLFWKNLAPFDSAATSLEKAASPAFQKALAAEFGSFEEFKTKANALAASVQGSGWFWLGVNPSTKRLEMTTTPNQDPCLTLAPVLGIDMWEHAFYLDYKNVKPDYLKAIWKVINWEEVSRRFEAAAK